MAAAAGQAMSPEGGEKPRASETVELEEARWLPVLGLLCEVSVEVPLPNFKVADFLNLKAGSVIPSGWRITRDVSLRVNGTLIGWGEFEGAGVRLGVRLTEIA